MNAKALQTLEYNKILSRLEDYAASEPGKALCRALLPSVNVNEIKDWQAETSAARDRVRMKGTPSFLGLPDVSDLLVRLEIGSTLTGAELMRISSLLTVADRARAYGCHDEPPEGADDFDVLESSFNALNPLPTLNREIKRCILSEDEVADDASAGLLKVRQQMKAAQGRIHTQLNQVLNESRSYLQDALITMRDGAYCLCVKTEYKNKIPGMIRGQSQTGSTVFIEPLAIIRVNNELRELEIKEQKEIEYILIALSGEATPYQADLKHNQELLARLDFIFAKAALSRHLHASEPEFNTDGHIHLKEARHPLLDPANVVPVNIWLGEDFNQLIITGPNTGGKTVSLKTVGLLTLMGQAGLHIPAFEGSKLAVFTQVFADIGDEQSIELSLSTFSAHMTNIVGILESADPDSLCLFDELCSGTDPTEGAALAAAILTFLHNMKCTTMATTHYSELKVFALTTPGIENASCEFDVETLRPTYRLLIGIPGKSNAFAIAGKLGLSDYIITDAKNRLEKQDASLEDLLADLENSRLKLEKEHADITAYKEEISRLKKNLAKKEENLEGRSSQILRSANEEAQRILREAKETADEAIRQINKAGSGKAGMKELEQTRTKLREQMKKGGAAFPKKEKDPAKAVSARKLKIGDGVHVLSMNLNGTVSSLPNAKGDLYVQMGILRSLVNVQDLELIEEEDIHADLKDGTRRSYDSANASARKGKTKPNIWTQAKGSPDGQERRASLKSYDVSAQVNLIGMTVDEALPVMEKYLDDAYLAHLQNVRVVHGRGTGALKNAVHKRLRKLSYVKEFRLGEFGEGQDGVTVVTFK